MEIALLPVSYKMLLVWYEEVWRKIYGLRTVMRQNVGSMRENSVKFEEAEEKKEITNKIFHH